MRIFLNFFFLLVKLLFCIFLLSVAFYKDLDSPSIPEEKVLNEAKRRNPRKKDFLGGLQWYNLHGSLRSAVRDSEATCRQAFFHPFRVLGEWEKKNLYHMDTE